MSNPSGLEIAIVGMGGRFPQAGDTAAFWANLRDGVESVRFFADEELLAAGVDPNDLTDPRYVRAQAVLDDVAGFDAELFDLAPREAALLDPQQRLLLECAWEAMEQAGQVGGNVGVFTAVGFPRYLITNLLVGGALAADDERLAAILNDKDHVSTRIAYKLGLSGPAVTVQSACSSSLVAVHVAAQALLAGECDAAIAGGATIRLPQHAGYRYVAGGVDSIDGHCRPFDATASGLVRGSGGGVVMLRRLEDVLRDGGEVMAVIRGSAVNNDGGAKMGYTAPSVTGQARVIRAAHLVAGVSPDEISYVETHGTGTRLGDPVEIAALTRAFRAGTARSGFCALGATKANIGHLDVGSGIAGLIKVVLALRNRQLPPALNFASANPEIDFPSTPFFINTELRTWESDGVPRRAGVSSFGIGGTNAHVIVEEAPADRAAPRPPSSGQPTWRLLRLSGRTPAALRAAAERLAVELEGRPEADLADVAHTLRHGRRELPHRQAVLARTPTEAVERLRSAAVTGPAVGARPTVAFLFPGQGAQQVNAGLGLYRCEPGFRSDCDECAEVLTPVLGQDIRDVMFPPVGGEAAAAERLRQTGVAQPALFVLEYALARLLESWGVGPDVMVGHSVGEYVAACRAGVMTRDQALRLVAGRGRLMQSMPAGAMLAVALGEAELWQALPAGLDLAAVNGPARCVVSGRTDLVDGFAARLAVRGVNSTRLATSHAFHSAMMDPVLSEFRALVAAVPLAPPQLGYLSNLTGTRITAAQATDPDYWVRHLREPIRFHDNAAEVLADPAVVAVEVGPGRTLTGLMQQLSGDAATVRVLDGGPVESDPDGRSTWSALGALWVRGVPVAEPLERGRPVVLPTYPFQRRRHWIEASPVRTGASGPDSMFSTLQWRPAGRAVAALPPPGLIVVAGEPNDLCGQIVDRLRAQGCEVRRLEETAERFAADEVIYVAPSAADGDPRPAFRDLVRLTQRVQDRFRLTVVTRGMQPVSPGEAVDLSQAALTGIAVVLPQERPEVTCRLVDLPATVDRRGLEGLLAELSAREPSGAVAYRAGQRLFPTHGRVSLPTPAEGWPGLRERGGYLLTGGLGAVGLELAAHLATSVRARLVLVSRRPASAEVQARVDRLTELGAEVWVRSGDVAETGELHRIVAEATERFGRIDGVFHLAFAPGGGLISLRTDAEIDAEFRAKAGGARALAEVFAGADLDFMAFFSSINAFIGGAGAAAYAGACAYVDRLAGVLSSTQDYPVVSVNWGIWKGLANEELEANRRRRGLPGGEALGITPAQGLSSLRQILASGLGPQVAVTPVDLNLVTAVVAGAPGQPSDDDAARARPDLSTPYREPAGPIEPRVALAWCRVLGLTEVGVDDSLTELGGDSLAAIQILARLRESDGWELPLHDFFADPTVAGNAAAILRCGQESPAAGEAIPASDADLSSILTEIEGMTDEHIAMLLREEV